ncbi:hypothetical protein MCC01972_08470 [Bifidobacteriaceae bacterium MCC01972]|nr:hypothetical protein MCC01972_08470 [Bifidobacteriaceae bacterium MCC01972]GDZ00035.1 hypothetical protein MCC01975_13660 [Bifidobacteriaceae bacterium MCC01975]
MLKPKRVAAMRSCADSILQKDEMAQVDDVRIADTVLVPAPEAAGIRAIVRLWAWGRCSLFRY